MTTPPDAADRVIADGVLPAEIDELAVPAELDKLLPWHRPRKQLIREKQWIHFSRRLIKRNRDRPGLLKPATSAREVRYLTLPGIDYLDVRQLADVCRDLDCGLTSTGFQAGGERNRYVARAQVTEKALIDSGRITSRSYTFARRFEDVADSNSPAYRDLRCRAPFHIVNVDVCGSMASPLADHANRLIDALYRLVELQIELMSGSWLLFVTTDVRKEAFSESALAGLCAAIFENATEDRVFGSRAANLLDVQEDCVRAAAAVAAQRAGAPFLRLFSLGLAKWLLHMVRRKGWEMETHLPYCYSTKPQGDDTPSMVCLAFEFLPPPPGLEDPYGVANTTPTRSTPVQDTAFLALEKIGEMTNADAKMRSDAQLRARMTRHLGRWLEDVGYPSSVLEELCA